MAAAYCYEGIPLRFLASLFIHKCESSVYQISMVASPFASAVAIYRKNIHVQQRNYLGAILSSRTLGKT